MIDTVPSSWDELQKYIADIEKFHKRQYELLEAEIAISRKWARRWKACAKRVVGVVNREHVVPEVVQSAKLPQEVFRQMLLRMGWIGKLCVDAMNEGEGSQVIDIREIPEKNILPVPKGE